MDYREALRETLARRSGVNARYSLRAFARDLGLSPSYLSQVLSGSRGLTLEGARRVFGKVGLGERESTLFRLQIEKEHRRTDRGKQEAQKKIDRLVQDQSWFTMSPDAFATLGEWYSMVLLQLLHLRKAPLGSRKTFTSFAAKALGVSAIAIRQALDTVTELGLIRESGRGLRGVHSTVWAGDVPHEAIRRFHRQMLDKAAAALELQSVDKRSFHALQIPLRKADYPELEREIIKFRKYILRRFGKTDGTADTVYALQLQLFDLLLSKK